MNNINQISEKSNDESQPNDNIRSYPQKLISIINNNYFKHNNLKK